MTAARQGHLFRDERLSEPLHDALLSRGRLPQHMSDRGIGGRDEDWWLRDGVDSIVTNRGTL